MPNIFIGWPTGWLDMVLLEVRARFNLKQIEILYCSNLHRTFWPSQLSNLQKIMRVVNKHSHENKLDFEKCLYVLARYSREIQSLTFRTRNWRKLRVSCMAGVSTRILLRAKNLALNSCKGPVLTKRILYLNYLIVLVNYY